MDSDILFFHYIQDDVVREAPVLLQDSASIKMVHRLLKNSYSMIKSIPFTYVYYCGPSQSKNNHSKFESPSKNQ